MNPRTAAAVASLFALAPMAEADLLQYSFHGTITQDLDTFADSVAFGNVDLGDAVSMHYVFDTDDTTIFSSTTWGVTIQSVTIDVTTGGSKTTQVFDNLSADLATLEVSNSVHDLNWYNIKSFVNTFGVRLAEEPDSPETPDTSLNGLAAGQFPPSIDPASFDSGFTFSVMRYTESSGLVGFIASVDSVEISQIPAPSSAALLGVAGFVATRRRR